MIANNSHESRNHFFALQKLITITIVFHLSYQCAIMLEITLNMVSTMIDYYRHFIR